ncbi:MAG: T9SS type A sorting domain-containing protein [Bacteroidetes bacterium]|nr:T9SS type A sorting domain-containing protein [Bacteroidota bacterium]
MQLFPYHYQVIQQITFFIGKTLPNGTGQILIERGNSSSNVYSVFSDFVLDNNDDIIIGGRTSVGNDFGNGVTLTSKGYFIAKYNNQGVAQWARTYNFGNPNITSFSTEPWKLKCLPNGEILAIRIENNRFNLIRLDQNGNELQNTIINLQSPGSNTLRSSYNNCIADDNGNFYLYINSTNNQIVINNDTTKITNGSHPATAFIFAYDKFGVKRYSKAWRGSIKDIALEKQTSNLFISWVQYGGQQNLAPMDNLNGNNGTFIDSFSGIVCTDSNGNFIKKSVDNQPEEYPYEAILPINNGRLLATFKHSSSTVLNAGTQTYSAPTGSLFTWVELDANLNRDYFVAEPNINQSNSTPLPFMSCFNSKVVVGLDWFASDQNSISINGITLTANDQSTTFPIRYNSPFNMFGTDVTLAQFDRSTLATIGLNPEDNVLSDIMLFPNPATNEFTIHLEELDNQSVLSLTNLLGQKFITLPITEKINVINTSKLNRGVYLVTISNGKTIIQKKLLVE